MVAMGRLFATTLVSLAVCVQPVLAKMPPVPTWFKGREIASYPDGVTITTETHNFPSAVDGCIPTDIFQAGRFGQVNLAVFLPLSEIRPESMTIRRLFADIPRLAEQLCAGKIGNAPRMGLVGVRLVPSDVPPAQAFMYNASLIYTVQGKPGLALQLHEIQQKEEIVLANGDPAVFSAIVAAGGANPYKRAAALSRVKALPPIPTQSLCAQTIPDGGPLFYQQRQVRALQPAEACRLRDGLARFSDAFNCPMPNNCNAADPKTLAVIREVAIPGYITLLRNFQAYMAMTPSDQLAATDWLQGAYNDFVYGGQLYKGGSFALESDARLAQRPAVYQELYKAIWLYRTAVTDAYLQARIPRLAEKKSKAYTSAMKARWAVFNSLSPGEDRSAYMASNHDLHDMLEDVIRSHPRVTAQQMFSGYDGINELHSMVSSPVYERRRAINNKNYANAHRLDALAPVAALALGAIALSVLAPSSGAGGTNEAGFSTPDPLHSGANAKATAFGQTWNDLADDLIMPTFKGW